MLWQDDRGIDIPAASGNQDFELTFTALIAISRSAKISLNLNADMSGLRKFIRQEIHDNTAHAQILDITIPANAWTAESSIDSYAYTAEVTLESVTAEESPTVTIHRESLDTAIACELCPVAETLDSGALKLWAKHLPGADMTATVLLVSPKSSEPLDDDSTDDIPETTSIVGYAVCGKAIVGT